MSSFRSKILRPLGLAAALTLLLAAAPAMAANLTWNTFQGGALPIDTNNDIYVDALAGAIYVAGETDQISWGSPVRPHSGGNDGFVARYDIDGTLVWLTFLGGAGSDAARALTGDGLRIYVAGNSSDTWGSPVEEHHGNVDAFVAALDPTTGALQWNTFAGSSRIEEAGDIHAHGGAIYTTGYVTVSPLGSNPGTTRANFARFDSAGNKAWERLVGTSAGNHQGRAIRVDSHGDLLILGSSTAAFPITGLTPARPYSGLTDAFLLKVRISDQAVQWFTFLGGPGLDIPWGLAVKFDNIYVTGSSESTWGSPVSPHQGREDGFVARLFDGSGSLSANTFLGSAARDYAYDIQVAANSGTRLYVAGASTAAWGTGVLRPYTGGVDGFAAELDLGLNQTHITFLGGPAFDRAAALGQLFDRLFVVGESNASWSESDCAGCPLRPYSGFTDGFLTRLPTRVSDLVVTKTDNRSQVFAGETIQYEIAVRNDGPDDISGAQVTDVLPAILQNVSWTCSGTGGASCTGSPGTGDIASTANLPNGGEVIYLVSATVPPNATGNLINTATVTALAADPDPGNNWDDDFSVIRRVADLEITKTDNLAQAAPGAAHQYTIVVSNLGPSDAPGTLVSDTFPAAFTGASWACVPTGGATCAAGSGSALTDTINLPVGSTVTYTVAGTINGGATGVLSNTASVAAGSGVSDLYPSNNTATDTTSLSAAADLAIDKDDGTKTVTAGGTTTYTIVASNAGPSPATGVTVSDSFPASLTGCNWTCTPSGAASCTAGPVSGDIADTVNLPAGDAVTYTATCNIDGGATGSISNTATVSGPDFDPNPANNSDSDIDGVGSAADLLIVKSDGRLIAAPGEQLVYAIAVTNFGGPSAVNGATVTDTFPPILQNVTWTCSNSGGGTCLTASGSGNLNAQVSLGANQSVEFTVFATIDPAAPAGTLTNTATVSSPVTDTNPTNNTATDTTALEPLADLVAVKSDGRTAVTGGEATSYQILVSNTGPSHAPSANVVDNFPAALTGATWTCSASAGATCTAAGSGNISDAVVSLPAGATLTYIVQATIDPDFVGTLSNTASVAASPAGLDPIVPNNAWTDTTEVFAGADLAITKTDYLDEAKAGDGIVYTIGVTNAGPSDVANALVNDALPSGLVGATWTCVASGGANCGAAAGAGDLNQNVSVPVGGSVTYSVSGTIDPSFADTLSNTATVTAGGVIDIDVDNDTATDNTDVSGGTPTPIPTLGGWGLGLLVLLFPLLAGRALRRRVA
jgi:uncharacterized repeat protein (TIGR01451 family)